MSIGITKNCGLRIKTIKLSDSVKQPSNLFRWIPLQCRFDGFSKVSQAVAMFRTGQEGFQIQLKRMAVAIENRVRSVPGFPLLLGSSQ